MSIQTMSVHRALAELKTYDDRIAKTMQATFVVANQRNNDKIQGKTIAEVESRIQGNFDSYFALVENQRRIKVAIVKSNAVTKVTIDGKEYTVAEAIERKAKVKNDESFLRTLKAQFTDQNGKVDRANSELPAKLETYLHQILGPKDKRTADEIAQHTELYEKKYKWELVDPCDIMNKIKELEERILTFKTEVDYVLSESNALTKIEVEFTD